MDNDRFEINRCPWTLICWFSPHKNLYNICVFPFCEGSTMSLVGFFFILCWLTYFNLDFCLFLSKVKRTKQIRLNTLEVITSASYFSSLLNWSVYLIVLINLSLLHINNCFCDMTLLQVVSGPTTIECQSRVGEFHNPMYELFVFHLSICDLKTAPSKC